MNKLLLVVVGLATAPAFAQSAPVINAAPMAPASGVMGARVQARADVVARTQRMFAMLDTNRDNVLSQAEVAAVANVRHGDRDAAASGRMAGKRSARFDMIDANHDGAISREEFARAPMHHRAGGMARMWTKADANHDGGVTLQEATDLSLKRFDRRDANHDGRLTPDERAAVHARMGGSRDQ